MLLPSYYLNKYYFTKKDLNDEKHEKPKNSNFGGIPHIFNIHIENVRKGPFTIIKC